MNLNELQSQLLAAARAHPPDDRVPYAFEKRILARLAEKPALDTSAWWLRGLWRAAASCVAICVLAGAWTFISPAGASSVDELSQQFENTVFAAMEHDSEYAW
jgi:hypothetical protein